MIDIFSKTDVLSLHIPLTKETAYLLNEKYINNFTKNIYLINTSRGKVVKTSSIVKALRSGKLLGAALDVLEYENLTFEDIQNMNSEDDFDYLSKAENVILTPHVAGLTEESNLKLAKVIFEKISLLNLTT
jgi:D-3-phosphoglycerate dehydrogenase